MKVCILLSTYNGEKYLRQQLDSLLSLNTLDGQIDFHIFARDDGSTDSSLQILQEYHRSHPKIFQLEFGTNLGFAKSFSWLVHNAPQADFYAFCDQDDIWLKDKISNAVQRLKNEPQNLPCLYSTSLIVVDKNLNEMTRDSHPNIFKHPETLFEENLLQNNSYGCTMVFNEVSRRLYMKVPVDEIVTHDNVLSVMCCASGAKFIFDDNPQILYRQHSANTIGFYKGSLRNILRTISYSLRKDFNHAKLRNAKICQKYFGELQSEEQKHFLDLLTNYLTDKNKKKKLVRYIKKNVKTKFIKTYSLLLIRLNRF